MQVAFLGLGAMGRPMVLNLIRAGHTAAAWNRTPRAYPDLASAGCALRPTPADAVQGADAVCVCVLDDAAVKSVVTQALASLRPGCVILDHSTVAVATAREMASRVQERGGYYLDAPVSGGTPGAAAATLTIMVGGDPTAFQRALPVLQCLGRHIEYMGNSGAGQATKLINQNLTAVHQVAAVEALYLAQRAGLELEALHRVLAVSYGASRMLDRSMPFVSSSRFASDFTVDLLHKDLGLIMALCEGLQVRLPLTEAAVHQYQAAKESGLGPLDGASLIKLLADIAGSDDAVAGEPSSG